MRTRTWVTILALILVASSAPLWAVEKGDQRFRVGALYSSPTGQFYPDDDDGFDEISADSAFGFAANYEFMASNRFGVQPGVTYANHDIGYGLTMGVLAADVVANALGEDLPSDLGSVSALTLTASGNIHLTRSEKVDFCIGPTIGYVIYGDWDAPEFMDVGSGSDVGIENDFTYGANLALDVGLSDKIGLFGTAGYMFTSMTVEDDPDGGDVDVDPIVTTFGLSFRF